MTKKWVLAVALLSLAISMGCRNVTGVSKVKVSVSDGNLSVLYVTQVVQFTATVTGTSNTGVTWSLSGTACTGSPNPCGTLDANGKYTAPPTAPNPSQVTITATSQADSTISDSLSVNVHQITVQITPNPANVGIGLTQQFTAVVIPDDAPQAVTWTIPTCTGGNCGNIDSNGIYSAAGATAGATLSVQAAVPAALDPSGSGTASVTVVNSRLGGNSSKPTNYTFRFSGFDTLGNATALAGNFVVSTDGIHISSGVEDLQTATNGFHEYSITGTYSAVSNNQGTISLSGALAGTPNSFTAVLDSNGDIQMIESDGNGTGSGAIEQLTTAPSKFDFTSLCGSFVFGFTGVDISGKRVGYVGVLPMDGNQHIGTACGGTTSPGLVDINDGGTASSATDVSGSYTMSNGVGSMTLTSGTFGTFHFNLYVVSGVNPPKPNNPTTLYAISTDAHPVISGTVVFQAPDNKYNYNNKTLNGTSVVSLSGADNSGANVSLSIVNTDGNGGLSGNFDQNDAGTILSVSSFSTGYTYLAAPSGSGRYTFQLLGNPNANVKPIPFVLYASAANQGFLLDQSSTSVMTGTMYLQSAPKAQAGIFSASNIPGTYAAATTSSGASGVDPIAANLLLTWVNNETCKNQCVDGTQYDASGNATVTGAYTFQASGFGTFTLTAPSAESYVIYAIDITHILVMDVDKTNANASIIYAQQ